MVGMKEGRFKNSFREFGNNGYKCLSVVASLSRPEYRTSVVLTRQAEHLLSYSECACRCACVLCVCGGGSAEEGPSLADLLYRLVGCSLLASQKLSDLYHCRGSLGWKQGVCNNCSVTCLRGHQRNSGWCHSLVTS